MNKKHTSSRSREARERRRLKAGTLFKAGMSQADVARTLRVTPASVHGWYHAWKTQGVRGLKSKGKTGFPSSFTDTDRKKLKKAIIGGARTNRKRHEAHEPEVVLYRLDVAHYYRAWL